MRNKNILENLEELWNNLDKIHTMLKLLDPTHELGAKLIAEYNHFLDLMEKGLDQVQDSLSTLVKFSEEVIKELELSHKSNKVVYGPDIENMDPKKFFKA